MLGLRAGFGALVMALAWLSGTAHASGPVAAAPATAAVLPVALTGTTDDGGDLTRAVRDAVGEGFTLLPVARVTAALAGADAGCVTPICARRLAQALAARWLVRSRVSADGNDYDLEVTFVDGATGEAQPPRRAPCLACGWAEVAPRLGQLTRQATQAASRVHFTASPPSPQPADGGAGPSRPAARAGVSGYTVGKWVAAAAAVGLLATSAVMFAYDGRGTCDLPPEGAGKQCPFRYDTALEAGVFLGAGAVAAGVAVTLFVLDRRAPPVVPTAQATPGGAVLGVAGAF